MCYCIIQLAEPKGTLQDVPHLKYGVSSLEVLSKLRLTLLQTDGSHRTHK